MIAGYLELKSILCLSICVEFYGYLSRQRKTGVLGEKPLRAGMIFNYKLSPHMVPILGLEPGQHWWEVSALATAPSLL